MREGHEKKYPVLALTTGNGCYLMIFSSENTVRGLTSRECDGYITENTTPKIKSIAEN